MAEFKLVLSDPKTGKSFQKEVKDDAAKPFLGKSIGDTVKGEAIDLTGYEFKITGGSDKSGFPMRRDVTGTGRKRILSVKTAGLKIQDAGIRKRKTMAGNTVHAKIAQINLAITKHGKAQLGEPAGDKAKPTEEKPAEEKSK